MCRADWKPYTEDEETLLAEPKHAQEEHGEAREQGRLGTLNAQLLNPKSLDTNKGYIF